MKKTDDTNTFIRGFQKIRRLETITGYDFFADLPDEIEEQLEARNGDSFINDYLKSSLLADSTVFPSDTFQTGSGVNLPISHDDSNPIITEIRSVLASREINVSESIVSFKTTSPNSSSQSAIKESSHSDVSFSERSIIDIALKKVGFHQDSIVEVGSTQVGFLEISPIQVSSLETNSFEIGVVEDDIHQIASTQVGSGQNNSTNVQGMQTGTTPINSREVSFPIFESFGQILSSHNSSPTSYLLFPIANCFGVVTV